MTELKLERVTLTGEKQAVTFDEKGKEFLVKNFSEDPVYVSFELDATDDSSIKILPEMAQICSRNGFLFAPDDVGVDTIYVKGTGEVEVQNLWY